jgi:hypothetical protein
MGARPRSRRRETERENKRGCGGDGLHFNGDQRHGAEDRGRARGGVMR